jgi:hypothetical protein
MANPKASLLASIVYIGMFNGYIRLGRKLPSNRFARMNNSKYRLKLPILPRRGKDHF